MRALPVIFKRLSSTATSIPIKPTPSKVHLHRPIADNLFPAGWVASGKHVGVKKNQAIDLSLVLSTTTSASNAAANFTRNAFKAAPVLVSHEVLKQTSGKSRGVVVNSGCANAVTGKQGVDDAWAMVEASSALLDPDAEHETLVMSTGVIGQNLPISKIINGIKSQNISSFGSSFADWELAAKGFLTTDTFPKLRARAFNVRGVEYRLAGMTKGAGMIHPDMGPASLHATLLGCIVTDAAVSSRSLQSALAYAVDRSFNSISVDGEMSTNDTVILMANGAANKSGPANEIDEGKNPEDYIIFRDVLTDFAAELAQLVVRDGEGATKFVTVSVEGAATYRDAHAIASRISTSALVKTALYGEDANWGRILAASGSLSGLSTPLIPEKVSVSFVPVDGSPVLPLLVNGEPERVDEVRAKEILTNEDLQIRVGLGLGQESAKYWTCDFSYEYVRINGDYRS